MPIRMRPRSLPDAQMRVTAFQNIAMSKPVGKVLDSKVGKAGVKVGNTVKKIVRKLKPDGKKIKEDLFGSAERDQRQIDEARALNRIYSGR